MQPADDLIAAYWRLVPERIARATELWLGYEDDDPEALRELKRLLHTMKGEAHMLGLALVGQLLAAAERVIARLPVRDAPDAGTAAAALLESFEVLVAELGVSQRGSSDQLNEYTQKLIAVAASLPERVVVCEQPVANDVQMLMSAPPSEAPAMPAITLDPQRVQPLTIELRRLLEERAEAALKLREAQRMLRAMLTELDPALPPELLAQRAIKMLGYGWEVERRVSEVRTLWSTGEFAFEQSLDELEDLVHAAALVHVGSLLPRMVRLARSTAAALDKEVELELRGDAAVDAAVAQRLETALVHLVRNAVDHGIEAPEQRLAAGKPARGSIRIEAAGSAGRVEIALIDDGRGADLEVLRAKLGAEAEGKTDQQVLYAIFRHGLSTREQVSEISGRGVGLDVVLEEVRGVGGSVQVESQRGRGMRFVLRLPTSMRVDTIMPLRVGAVRCGLPSYAVVQVTRSLEIEASAQGPRARVALDGGSALLRFASLHRLLGEPESAQANPLIAVVAHADERVALQIDGYGSPRPMALQERNELMFSSPLVAAATSTADGHVLLVLDPVELLARCTGGGALHAPTSLTAKATVKHIIVAEDAPVARELLCGILRSFGLQVSDAADGRQALALAKRHTPDLLMTDLEMPFMGGIELIEALRRDSALCGVPVIVLTTRDDTATRERVLSLGVRGLLTKQKFVETQLRELIDACLEKA